MSDLPCAPTEDARDHTVRTKSGFAGDVLKLVSGTTFAQLITILAAPVLTRLYAPEAFGAVALFTSITSIVGVVACLRYELAIMLPERDEEAANLLSVSLGFVFLITLFSIPLIWWNRGPLLRWLNAPYLMTYLWLIPLSLLINGIFLALNYWNSRTRHFGRLSIARVTSALATAPSTIGLGFAGYATAGSMIGATIAGQAVAMSVLGGQIWQNDRNIFLKAIRWESMLRVFKRYKKFPIFGTWAGLLNVISWQLPVLMFGTFFTPEVVGFYSLGFRILQMPMSLIGGAIGQVFHQRAAVAKIHGTLAPLVENLIRRLLIVSIFPMLMLTIVGRDLYIFVFGERWAEAGVYTQILSIWAIVWFISSPLSTLYGVLGKNAQGLVLQLIIFISRFISIGIGSYFGNARLALFLFSISGVFVYGYLIFKISVFAGFDIHRSISRLYRCARISLLFLLLIVLIKLMEIPILTIGVAFICTISYFYVLRHDILSDNQLKLG